MICEGGALTAESHDSDHTKAEVSRSLLPWLLQLFVLLNVSTFLLVLWTIARFGSIHDAIRFVLGDQLTAALGPEGLVGERTAFGHLASRWPPSRL
jgi:hypothetical protein